MTQTEEQSLPEIIARAYVLIGGGEEGFAEATELCARALALDPPNTNATYILGVIALRSGHPDQAVRLGAEILRRNPDAPAAIHLLGYACYEQGNHEEARGYFIRVLERAGSHADCLRMLAKTEIKLGNYEAAEKWACQALDCPGGDGDSFLTLGVALSKQGKVGDAISAYREALKFPASAYDALSNLTAIQQSGYGKGAEAEGNYRSLIEQFPENIDVRYNLAILLRDRGRFQESLKEARTIAAINPDAVDPPSFIREGLRLLEVAENARRKAQDIAPLFLVSPVKCGGLDILHQSASTEIEFFGENEDISQRLPKGISFAITKADNPELSCKELEAAFSDDWSVAGVFPGEGKTYLSYAIEAFYSAVARYQATAVNSGKRWGMQVESPCEIWMLRMLLPNLKFVFVYRNLFDIARIHKTRGWLLTEWDVVKLAHNWESGIRQAFKWGEQNVLWLKYEDMIAETDKVLAEIERFAGFLPFERDRVVAKCDEQTMAQEQYLSQREIEILGEHASPMLQVLEYMSSQRII